MTGRNNNVSVDMMELDLSLKGLLFNGLTEVLAGVAVVLFVLQKLM